MGKELMTVIGYIVFTIYTCGIMGFGILLEKKTNLDKTICRKITHIISALVWIICYFFFGCSIHWVILNIVGAVLLGIVTLSDKFSAFGRDDSAKSPGMFYFGLSTAVVALICFLVGEELYLYTGIAYYCLALGDGFAPITAKLFAKSGREICPGKSFVGTLTVFVVSLISTLVFSNMFGMGLSIGFVVSVAALTTVAEFYGFKGTDNISIEFLVFGYLVLYHFGLVTPLLEIVMILSPALAILAVGSGAMARDGGFAAFLLFAFVGFFGGLVPIIFIGLLFFISTVVSVVGKKIDKKRQSEAHSPRRATQIIAVGLFPVIAIILHYITKIDVFYYMFYLALIEQIADSMASDIGRLTKKKNISIITLRPVEKGISGGISTLGTACAFISSFLLGLIPLAFNVISVTAYVMISAFAFVGTLIDSVVGGLFQSLYFCDNCKTKIESPMHCDRPARLIKGYRVIDNVAVNYIAGGVTCLMGLFLVLI